MNNKIVGPILAISSLFIVWVHITAFAESWYWQYKWLDIPMHFLGGFVVALLILFLLNMFNVHSKYKNMWIILLTLLIAVFWEVFEYQFRIIDPNYALDTTLDFVMGALGASFVVLIVYLYEKRNKEN